MASNEEPNKGSVFFDAESAVIVVHTDRPKGPDAFEMKGGMPVIFQPELILLSSPCLHGRWQAVVPLPEIRRDGGMHREESCDLLAYLPRRELRASRTGPLG